MGVETAVYTRIADSLVSVNTGRLSLFPDNLSLRIPILASTSTIAPGRSRGCIPIIWWMKSATSRMNSSTGSTPRMDNESGGMLLRGDVVELLDLWTSVLTRFSGREPSSMSICVPEMFW